MYIPNSKIIGAGGVVVPTPTVELLPANSYNRVAADLNGSTQYFTQAPIPLFGTIYSASVWFNADTVDVNQTVFLLGHVTDSSQIKFRIYLLNNVLWAQTREGESNRIGSHTVTQNTWYNVVYTRSGNTQNIYVNGALVDTDNTSSFSGTPTPSFFSIGVNISSTEYFNGRIQDAAVWDGTALTLADAQAIWASGAGLNIADYTTLSATPSSAWALSETSGTRYDYYGAADATAFGDPGYGVGISGFIQDNDPVSLIVDSSGNGNDASQLVLASRALYDVDAFGVGKPGWTLDGVNDFFGFGPIPIVLPSSFYAVVDTTNLQTGSRLMLSRDPATAANPAFYIGSSTDYAPAIYYNNSHKAIGTPIQGQQIVRWKIDSTHVYTRQNGNAEVAQTHGTTLGSVDWYRINDNVQSSNMKIGHMYLFNGVTITPEQDNQIFTDLNDIYGIY